MTPISSLIRAPAIAAAVMAAIAIVLGIAALARHNGGGGNFTVSAIAPGGLALITACWRAAAEHA